MRKAIHSLVLVTASTLIFASCKKDVQSPALAPVAPAMEIINASISSQDVYTLSFDPSSQVTIHAQAKNFMESSASINNETGKIVYRYVPKAGFSGSDEVTLSNVKKILMSETSGVGCGDGKYGNETELRETYSKSLITVKLSIKP